MRSDHRAGDGHVRFHGMEARYGFLQELFGFLLGERVDRREADGCLAVDPPLRDVEHPVQSLAFCANSLDRLNFAPADLEDRLQIEGRAQIAAGGSNPPPRWRNSSVSRVNTTPVWLIVWRATSAASCQVAPFKGTGRGQHLEAQGHGDGG